MVLRQLGDVHEPFHAGQDLDEAEGDHLVTRPSTTSPSL